MKETYTVENGVVYAEEGIPYLPRWFSEDRVVFEVDKYGISNVEYWNKSSNGKFKVFCDNLWGGMRFFVESNGLNYAQKLKFVEMLPHGFRAKWEWKGQYFSYAQRSIHDCIVISIRGEKPADAKFKFEFYDQFGFTPLKSGDYRFVSPVERQWFGWREEAGFFINGYEEEGAQTGIVIGANVPLVCSRSEHNLRYTFRTPLMNEEEYVYVIAFDIDEEKAKARCEETLNNYKQFDAEIETRYARIAERVPKLKSAYPLLDQFMALEPMFAESLKVKEYPGAVRAKTTFYWVWGWDGMTSNYATAYKGETELIKNLLDLYMIYSDEEKGIVHAYKKNMEIAIVSALPAQGMYITLLYLYFANGGDITPYYEFAKKIFHLICAKEIAEYGLCEGSSLFPDYPVDMLETGHDISSFNNTVFYTAVRSMEALADYMGDQAMTRHAHLTAEKIEKYFKEILFDQEKGFVVTSADSVTHEKRPIFNSNAVKWENNFLADLMADMDAPALRFCEENTVTDMGLREIPVWCEAYDKDANQLHCWWPVTGEYFARLINQFNRRDLIEKWVSWVSLWTERLMCPEGISCYIETKEPDFDHWNCQPGTWQAYSGRAWYEAALHAVVGVGGDFGGLTFYPYGGEEAELLNFWWNGTCSDIYVRGSGRFIRQITVNGTVLRGTNKLPEDLLGKRNEIIVERCETEECEVRIISGYGFGIREYRYEEGVITAKVSGYGHCRIRAVGSLYVDGIPSAEWIDFTQEKVHEIKIC